MISRMDEQGLPDEVSRLVVLGRDREAARLHTRSRTTTAHGQGETLNTTEQLDVVLPDLIEVAGRIAPDQMDNPTPCARFAVRDLFNHMIGGAGFFAAQFRGEPVPEPPAPETDLVGDDASGALRRALEELNAAVRVPGALERTIAAPFGEVPGAVVAQFLVLDGMVHTWDLARATGQRYQPPEELAGEVLAFARQAIAPEMRDGDTFAAETAAPPGASNLEQLVAFTGRAL